VTGNGCYNSLRLVANVTSVCERTRILRQSQRAVSSLQRILEHSSHAGGEGSLKKGSELGPSDMSLPAEHPSGCALHNNIVPGPRMEMSNL